MNEYEFSSHDALKEVAERYGARVFSKVRLADVLPVENSGISNEQYGYALRAHFDFVVASSKSDPFFAVEFDGSQHTLDPMVIYRDSIKNDLCHYFSFPLLRIDSSFMRRVGRFSLLSYLAEVWFLAEEFNKAQQRGEVPIEEVFHPSFILAQVTEEGELERSPYDLARDAKRTIFSLMQKKVCDYYREIPALFGQDAERYDITLRNFSVEDGLMIGVGRCQKFHFKGSGSADLTEDLAWIDAADKIRSYLRGDYNLETTEDLATWKRKISPWTP